MWTVCSDCSGALLHNSMVLSLGVIMMWLFAWKWAYFRISRQWKRQQLRISRTAWSCKNSFSHQKSVVSGVTSPILMVVIKRRFFVPGNQSRCGKDVLQWPEWGDGKRKQLGKRLGSHGRIQQCSITCEVLGGWCGNIYHHHHMEEDERLEEILAYLSFISQNGKIQGGRKKK